MIYILSQSYHFPQLIAQQSSFICCNNADLYDFPFITAELSTNTVKMRCAITKAHVHGYF